MDIKITTQEFEAGRDEENIKNFKSKGRVVDEQGNPISINSGRHYRIIGKVKKDQTMINKIKGYLLILASIGFLYKSKKVQKLIAETRHIHVAKEIDNKKIRYGNIKAFLQKNKNIKPQNIAISSKTLKLIENEIEHFSKSGEFKKGIIELRNLLAEVQSNNSNTTQIKKICKLIDEKFQPIENLFKIESFTYEKKEDLKNIKKVIDSWYEKLNNIQNNDSISSAASALAFLCKDAIKDLIEGKTIVESRVSYPKETVKIFVAKDGEGVIQSIGITTEKEQPMELLYLLTAPENLVKEDLQENRGSSRKGGSATAILFNILQDLNQSNKSKGKILELKSMSSAKKYYEKVGFTPKRKWDAVYDYGKPLVTSRGLPIMEISSQKVHKLAKILVKHVPKQNL